MTKKLLITTGNQKLLSSYDFLDNFEILKLEVRLSADLKLLSIKHLSQISKMLDIIGKQATAWKNSN